MIAMEERRSPEPSKAFMIILVFVHAYEACYGHSNIVFTRKMKEICNFELGS
jgi:hypothetical protein